MKKNLEDCLLRILISCFGREETSLPDTLITENMDLKYSLIFKKFDLEEANNQKEP